MYNSNMQNIVLKIKTRLKKEADKDYKKFSSSLIPNINNLLGIRLPVLRKISKEIYESGEYKEYLKLNQFEYNEEVMLQGMVIGLLKEEPENIINYIKDFVPKIDNWSVCDSFCSGLKFTKKNLKNVWKLLKPYFKSDKEYELRFGYVMLLSYFVIDEYIDEVIRLIDNFKDDRYYSKMAVAWLISVCYVKFPKETFEYLKNSKLDKWTYNKSIQKICESYRINKNTKDILKQMKKN